MEFSITAHYYYYLSLYNFYKTQCLTAGIRIFFQEDNIK